MSGYHPRNRGVHHSYWNNGYPNRRTENQGYGDRRQDPHRQSIYGNQGSSSTAYLRSRGPSPPRRRIQKSYDSSSKDRSHPRRRSSMSRRDEEVVDNSAAQGSSRRKRSRSCDRSRGSRDYPISPVREKVSNVAHSSPPPCSAEVPDDHLEPKKVEAPATDSSLEKKKKSRKRSRHRSTSSENDVPRGESLTAQEKEQRQEACFDKLEETVSKIRDFKLSRTNKLKEKEDLSEEVNRTRETIAEKSEECQKRKRDHQMREEKQAKRGREAKMQLEAGIGNIQIGQELTGFNFDDTRDWLDVLKEVKEEMSQLKSEEEAIKEMESDVAVLQVLLEEKDKIMDALVDELGSLDMILAQLYSDLTAISEENLEFHGGKRHKKRRKRSKQEDREESADSSVVQNKDASQLLTDAVDNHHGNADKPQVDEESGSSAPVLGPLVAQEQRASFDSFGEQQNLFRGGMANSFFLETDKAPPIHPALLDHDYLIVSVAREMEKESTASKEQEEASASLMKTSEGVPHASPLRQESLNEPKDKEKREIETEKSSEGSRAPENAMDIGKTVETQKNGASRKPNESLPISSAEEGQGPDNTVSNEKKEESKTTSTEPGLSNVTENGAKPSGIPSQPNTGVRVPPPIQLHHNGLNTTDASGTSAPPLLDPSDIKEEVIDEEEEAEAGVPSVRPQLERSNAAHGTIVMSDGAQWEVPPSRAEILQSVRTNAEITDVQPTVALIPMSADSRSSLPTLTSPMPTSSTAAPPTALPILSASTAMGDNNQLPAAPATQQRDGDSGPDQVEPRMVAASPKISGNVANNTVRRNEGQNKQKAVVDTANEPSASGTSGTSSGWTPRGRKRAVVKEDQQSRGGPQLRSRKK